MISLSKFSDQVWLITGVAGFIGSNLLEELLINDQKVIGVDNFETGHQLNLDSVKESISAKQWKRFQLVEGDVSDYKLCIDLCKKSNLVLHQAALGSVPRSIENPLKTNQANISGFLNILHASVEAKINRFVFAASSSTYGDHEALPKKEENIGKPLSPYAVTKLANEIYAEVFSKIYDIQFVGLRYFNVFGKRQDPNGAYAAVIPKWINSMINNERVYINGDGETTRDFTHISNVISANILSATENRPSSLNQIYNVACGESISLNTLFSYIKKGLGEMGINYELDPLYKEFRAGDVRHSLADISKISNSLSYKPIEKVQEGIRRTLPWYFRNL